MTRDEAARRLAGLMPGWWYYGDPEGYHVAGLFSRPDGPEIRVPVSDAPLWESLAFLGRIAEAVGYAENFGMTMRVYPADQSDHSDRAFVRFGNHASAFAGDVSRAALLAAVAAMESRKESK